MKEFDSWTPPVIDTANVETGDMPGDSVKIGEGHILRANVIFKELLKEYDQNKKMVISVFGGSRVGKSEIGSLIAHYFKLLGIPSYVLSGDNYPYRIPEKNDAERLTRWETIGDKGLRDYLGTKEEINFTQVNEIIEKFKNCDNKIKLKRMGRTEESLFYEEVDFSNIKVLVLEWTHGNNPALKGVDYPIFLYSTPEETLEHRKKRARDKGVDSPFTSKVLGIEQEFLNKQGALAKIIINNAGEILSPQDIK